MSTPLPHIGAKGRYVFKPPLDTRVGNKVYTCIAIRDFSDVINQGRDPQALYYTPLSLDAMDYHRDLRSNPHLISLQSEMGDVVVVPAFYIESFPIAGGIAYEVMGLVVNLGALPIDMTLTHIHTAIKEVVLANLGVDATVRSVKLSETEYLSADEHAIVESARNQAITNRKTQHARLLEAQARIEELESERAALIQYIEENITPR